MNNLTECRIPSCHNTFVYGNNGLPLIQGEVCDDCNDLVVMARINLMNGVWDSGVK